MNSNPVGSRITRSISFSVHRKTHFASGMTARSASATAMPGYKCPPVPPPARKMVFEFVWVTRLDFERHRRGPHRGERRVRLVDERDFLRVFVLEHTVQQPQRRARN